MKGRRAYAASVALLSLLIASSPTRAQGIATGGLPENRVADPAAPPVSAETLLAGERFWPYRTALVRDWQPDGRKKPLAAGTEGVLIRVEQSGLARIDFGRDGLFEVPVAATDLVDRANQIRRGEVEKDAPNYMFSILPRLADPESETVRLFRYERGSDRQVFLAVYADPQADSLEAIAEELAPLAARRDLLVILFPQGRVPDSAVLERLRAIDWKVPFVFDHLSEPYTRVQLGNEVALPAVTLETREGRLLFRAPWKKGLLADIVAAAERGSPAPPAKTASGH